MTPGDPGTAPGGGFSLFFSGLPTFPFSAILNMLEQSGLAKMLAEPTLVALSGQEAKFLVGGEFPIPIVEQAWAPSRCMWKKFGIILNFTPTVIADGRRFTSSCRPRSATSIPRARSPSAGPRIPGLTSRQSETTVRLADGQSFAIAGLLSDQDSVDDQQDPAPGRHSDPGRAVPLGELPAQRVRAPGGGDGAPGQAGGAARRCPTCPPTNELNDPNDIELFLFGSEGGGHADDSERYNEAGGTRRRRRSGRRLTGRGPSRRDRLHPLRASRRLSAKQRKQNMSRPTVLLLGMDDAQQADLRAGAQGRRQRRPLQDARRADRRRVPEHQPGRRHRRRRVAHTPQRFGLIHNIAAAGGDRHRHLADARIPS